MERRDTNDNGLLPQPRYLTKQQLMARTGLSGPTIQRYKRAGKIPFFQPGGPGAKILFPVNAIEAARQISHGPAISTTPTVPPPEDRASFRQQPDSLKLPGPRPRWQKHRGIQE